MTVAKSETSASSLSLRRRLYVILEAGKTGDLPSLVFDTVMVILIIANVVGFALQTVPAIDAQYGGLLELFNVISVLIFTAEYLLRLWVCVEHRPLQEFTPARARLKFMANPFMLIDLLAILPFYLSIFTAMDLRVLRVFRLLRFLKLVRYSPALASLWDALVAERRALLGALIVMLGLLMLASSLMYFIEGNVQPDLFGSVPSAMWWGIATLTTVGYGDAVPITALGRLVGGVVMILGLGMFAIPIGIIATGWNQEIHRREFVVTWGMVARVPLFSKLDAMSITEVMDLLRARVVGVGEVIARKGEVPHTMFFITTGRVRAELKSGPADLTDGDFFGAVALLKGIPSPVTIRAVTKTNLLCLEAEDFRGLIARDETLRKEIAIMAESRLAQGWMQSVDEKDAPPGGWEKAIQDELERLEKLI